MGWGGWGAPGRGGGGVKVLLGPRPDPQVGRPQTTRTQNAFFPGLGLEIDRQPTEIIELRTRGIRI